MILTFNETQTTDCAIVIITSDGIVEGQEDFTVMLSGQDGVTVLQSTATVTIAGTYGLFLVHVYFKCLCLYVYMLS